MSRHHLVALAAGAALVLIGAVFFASREEPDAAPVQAPTRPVDPAVKRWTEEPCPPKLVRVLKTRAHKRTPRCGRLWVPESEDARRSIEVGVIRLIPDGGGAKSPLLMLPGGPGDAFSHNLDQRLPTFAPLAKDREILIVDQRGTGRGKPVLECKRTVKTREHLDSCFRKWRADLDPNAYNTTQSARDLSRVLEHHRIEKVAVYAVSYGTRLAVEFAKLFPDKVERLLLDSPVPYRTDVLAQAAKNAEEALGRILVVCHQDAACREAFPITTERLVEIAEEMESREPDSGSDFLHALSKLSLHPDVIPYVPLLVAQVERGEGQLLRDLREGFSTYQSSFGLHLSVQCSEFFAHTTPEAIRRGESSVAAPFRNAFTTASYEDQCSGWAVAPRPELKPPEGLSVPVLVVSGALDPATPPEYGAAVKEVFPTSRHIVIDSVSHGAVFSSCGALVGRGFFEGGLESALPECVEEKPKFELGQPNESRIAQIVHQVRYRL